MKALAMRILAWVEHVLAFLALMILAVLLTVHSMGLLSREKVGDVLDVLRGGKRAVTAADHERWLALEKEAKSRSLVEAEEEIGSGQANEGFGRKKDQWQGQFDRELQMLETVNALIEDREKAFSRRASELAAETAALKVREEEDARLRDDANLRKALQIHQGRDAESVAQDFERKWAGGDAASKAEVVNMLRMMSPRFASEVVSAMADPSTRVSIMDEIRKG